MNIENLEVGMVVKNYKELCKLLDVKYKGGDGKKYQLVDFSRYFKWEMDGIKYVITEILDDPEDKKGRGGNNILPFIDEMEILIIDLLMKNNKEMIISNSKLLLELCMVNPNYYEFFSDKESLAEILEMDVSYIIDYYDSTNSTFKSAINTVMKRLESKKLIIHEKIMMVQFIDTKIHTTPTGYAKVSDIYHYDIDTDKYISKNVRPKETFRQATEYEREIILNIEKNILENDYKATNIQELFRNGKIGNYYKDVSRELFNTLNIKKAYKANRITIHKEGLKNEMARILNDLELQDIHFNINDKVLNEFDKKAVKRHNKALISKKKKDNIELRKSDQYITNTFTISDNLIYKDTEKLSKPIQSDESNTYDSEIDQYIIDNLPEDM